GAGGLAVEIKMQLALDGNVLRAGVVDQTRMLTDGFYRAAAESALRAVSRESRCTPLKLPRDDFEVWRDLVINFDPREVIGR
ncbi:MAG: energy transducer TonB, partial [Proteobacteria bacterium]|nr:energy transducer TonB [Pseudomonadota bacterium]